MAGSYTRAVFALIASTPGGLSIEQMRARLDLAPNTVSRAVKVLRALNLLRAIKLKGNRGYKYVIKPGAVCPGEQYGNHRRRWYRCSRQPSPSPLVLAG